MKRIRVAAAMFYRLPAWHADYPPLQRSSHAHISVDFHDAQVLIDVITGTFHRQAAENFGFCMDSHMLPIEQGRHLQLPRHAHVCKMCQTGSLGGERRLLLECPALADVRTQISQLIAHYSGIMAKLVWFKDQPLVSRYIIACLDMVSCH